MRNKIIAGFTLSEALVAIVIIGIISAVTIPGVVANYNKQAKLLKLKKVYTELQQNLSVMQTENYLKKGLYKSRLNLSSGKTISNTAGNFLKEYYKIDKDCATTAQPCFASSYKKLNGGSVSFSCSSGYSILLKSGTAMCLVPANNNPLTVYVDVNSIKNPNTGGRDMFTFKVYDDFSIDEVPPSDVADKTATSDRNTLFTNNCKSSATGLGCFGKILNDNWRMEY